MDNLNAFGSLTASASFADLLNLVRKLHTDSALYRRSCELLVGKLEIESAFPKRTGPREKRFLTIGMTTCNDYDGFFFTLQAIRMFHGEVLDDIDFLVIDNGSDLPCAKVMKKLEESIQKNFRYVPYRSHQATAVKDLIFREATGDFVLVMDSHVMPELGGLARLIAYLRANPETNDILHGPMMTDALNEGDRFRASQMDDVWARGGWGNWQADPEGQGPDTEPFEITKHATGLFCCRRAAWPGFNPRLKGYGCEEGYIHDKIRRAGGRAMCLPFLVWLHRFERPNGIPYPHLSEDRIRNFMIMYDEMGTDAEEMIRHYRGHLGNEKTDGVVRLARAEIGGPFHAHDAVYCIWDEERPDRREVMRNLFYLLGLEQRVRWYVGAKTPLDARIGEALSHRRIVQEARTQGLRSLLVFEDGNDFVTNTIEEIGQPLMRAAAGLKGQAWQISFLEGAGIAYESSVYDEILDLIPEDAFQVARLVAGLDEGAGTAMRQLLRGQGIEISHDPVDRPVPVSFTEVLEMVRRVPKDSSLYQRSCEVLKGKLEIESQYPKRTTLVKKAFLTIGMATCNDYDGVYFTIQSIRMFHPEILDDIEIIVIDNGSELAYAKAVKFLDSWIHDGDYRYIPYHTHQSTAVRDLIFREATGEFVLSTDCHVLYEPGSLAKLIAYLRANPETKDLLQGPLVCDDLKLGTMMGTHFEPGWFGGMYGHWGKDDRGMYPDGDPYEIEMQGLGMFCCRKAVWPGFNPRLMGFGGEEGYIQDKIRRAGGRAMCLPFLRWLHRFERPLGVRYPNHFENRIRNYMMIFDELGMAPDDMVRHFEEVYSKEGTDQAMMFALREITSPFHTFDAVYCIYHEDQPDRKEVMRDQFYQLGIEKKIRWYQAASTPMDEHIGAVLSHRRILAEAQMQELKSIIVFEDENQFVPNASEEMSLSLGELEGRDWRLSYLDGPGIAYDCSIYKAILTVVPDDAFEVARLVAGFENMPGTAMRQMLRHFGVLTEQEREMSLSLT